MVKKIVINCDFNGASQAVPFYIGDSALEKNPIGFQSRWLSEEKGGNVPEKLMDSLIKIKKISDEHAVPFDELYDFVVKEIESGKTLQEISISNKKKAAEIEAEEAKNSNSSSNLDKSQ